MKSSRNVLGILLLVEIALMLLFGYGYYRWTVEWRLNGAIVSAEITDKSSSAGNQYFVSYRYTVDGVSYTRQHQVEQSFFNGVVVGQTIEVKYSPADVSVSGISGQGIGDYGVERIPGTFFNLTFLGFILPGLIAANLALIVIMVVLGRVRTTSKRLELETPKERING